MARRRVVGQPHGLERRMNMRVFRIAVYGALFLTTMFLAPLSGPSLGLQVGAGVAGFVILCVRAFVLREELSQSARRFSAASGRTAVLALLCYVVSATQWPEGLVSNFFGSLFWISFAVWLSPIPFPGSTGGLPRQPMEENRAGQESNGQR